MIIDHNYESVCVYFLSIPFYALLTGDFHNEWQVTSKCNFTSYSVFTLHYSAKANRYDSSCSFSPVCFSLILRILTFSLVFHYEAFPPTATVFHVNAYFIHISVCGSLSHMFSELTSVFDFQVILVLVTGHRTIYISRQKWYTRSTLIHSSMIEENFTFPKLEACKKRWKNIIKIYFFLVGNFYTKYYSNSRRFCGFKTFNKVLNRAKLFNTIYELR